MRHNPDFVARRVADGLVLVPITRAAADLDAVFNLNAVGARIWELVPQCSTEEEIAAVLACEFEVEPEAALADVREFLTELRGLTAVLDN